MVECKPCIRLPKPQNCVHLLLLHVSGKPQLSNLGAANQTRTYQNLDIVSTSKQWDPPLTQFDQNEFLFVQPSGSCSIDAILCPFFNPLQGGTSILQASVFMASIHLASNAHSHGFAGFRIEIRCHLNRLSFFWLANFS